jgi:hypothetical protein
MYFSLPQNRELKSGPTISSSMPREILPTNLQGRWYLIVSEEHTGILFLPGFRSSIHYLGSAMQPPATIQMEAKNFGMTTSHVQQGDIACVAQLTGPAPT